MSDEPSAFEVGMVAGLRTELAAARAQLADAQAAVATWRECAEARAKECNLADIRIAELKAERDAARAFIKRHHPMTYRGLLDATDPGPEWVAETDAFEREFGDHIALARRILAAVPDSFTDAQLNDIGIRARHWVVSALREHGSSGLADATSPGPVLVAETRAALPVPACGLPPWFDEANAELDAHLATEADDPQPSQQNPVDGLAMPLRALRGGDGVFRG